MKIISNGIIIRVDLAPFVTGIVSSMARRGLLYKDDPLVPVDELDKVLKEPSTLGIDPDDVAPCFTPLGGFSLREAGLTLESGKEKLTEILLSDKAGRAILFNQIQLAEAVRNGIIETPGNEDIGATIKFKATGDTFIPQNKTQSKLRFLDGSIHAIPIVDNKGNIIEDPNELVSLYAHYDPTTKSSVLEITHVNRFDKTVLLQVPAHVYKNQRWVPAMYYLKVKLPPSPEYLIEIDAPIIGNQGAKINLKAKGLRIKDAEKRFFVRKKVAIGTRGIYETKKDFRPISGFVFEVSDDGKKLTISPLPINHGAGDKTILITATDKTGKDITVKFNICPEPVD